MIEPAWKREYRVLWLADKKHRYPLFFRDAHDPMVYLKWPKEKTANGLTRLIVKFLTFKGHYANRISTQGQARIINQPGYNPFSGKIQETKQDRWTKGTTKKGTPDISTIIHGKAVWIEVKIGADRMSDAQYKQKAEIEAAGGVYYIAKTMAEFYDWYKDKFERLNDDPDLYFTPE